MNPESHVLSRGGRLHRATSAYGIPEGAILLNKESVLKVQWTTIQNWKPRQEMWPYIHGGNLLASFGAIGGFVTNTYFRKKFEVQRYGRMGSFLPVILIPAGFSMIIHQMAVTNEILVGRFSCPICAELRSGTIQALLGGLYPCLMAPPLAIVIARKFYTYPIPKITQGKQVLDMLWIMSSPFKFTFIGILIGQFFMGMAIAKNELRVFNEKLSQGMLPRDPEDSEVEDT